jgi:citrate lyase beta subunit
VTKARMSAMRSGFNGAAQKEATEATELKMLGDSTRISLAIAIKKASKVLAERDGDELLKMSETALALAQAADIIHGWIREKASQGWVDFSTERKVSRSRQRLRDSERCGSSPCKI